MMLNTKLKIASKVIGIVFLLASGGLKAQQDPMFTQYMFNQLSINPAYAGTRDVLSLMFVARQQWIGFEGAPSTGTITGHMPVYNNMAVGTSLIYDSYGPVNLTSFYFDYAYQLKISNKSKLSLGLKGGFSNYSIDYNKLTRTEYTDDVYLVAAEQAVLPNFGFGLYLYGENYYVGLSIPRLVENEYKDQSETFGNGKEVRHYYGMAGVVYKLSNTLVVRPSLMTRLSQGAPISIDANINTILYDKFWLGAMHRLGESFGGIVQYQISPQLRVGYAFDLNTNQLNSYHSGTHEVMLSYEFNFKKEKIVNPRYF